MDSGLNKKTLCISVIKKVHTELHRVIHSVTGNIKLRKVLFRINRIVGKSLFTSRVKGIEIKFFR